MANRKRKSNPNYTKAALALREIGWLPFPLLPKSNILAVDLEEWQEGLSANRIRQYWRTHPDHGLGFVEEPADGAT
jgi:hypothetical protein